MMDKGIPRFRWLDLLAFCLSRACVAALSLALLITTASVALALVEGAETAQASGDTSPGLLPTQP